MNTYWVIGIIVFALGFIVSGILLLKQSANLPMPKVNKDNNASYDKHDEDDWDN